MTLRAKTLAVIGTTLLLMIVLIFSISKGILLGGYAKLEQQNILQNGEQAVRMIDDELAQIRSVVGDWAPWDDTYHFLRDGNREFIENNLDDSTIGNLPIDFMIFLTTGNTLTFCKYVDPATGEDAACPQSLLRYVTTSEALRLKSDDFKVESGLIILPEHPAFIAFGTVMTSRFEGPSTGTLIAGRYLTDEEVERLAAKVNLSVHLQRLDQGDIPGDLQQVRQSLSGKEKFAVVELGKDTIAAYTLLKDVQDKPILMLGIDRKRNIFAQGRSSLLYFMVTIFVTGLVFIAAALIFLETTVLSRLVRLSAEVKEIGRTADLSRRTTVHGQDELSALSSEINRMVESVRVSTERDHAILASIEDGYFEMDLKGNLTFFNDSLSRLFGYRKEQLSGMNYLKLLNISAAGKAFDAFRELYRTGRPITTMETAFVLANGEKIYLESTVSLIRNTAGAGIGFRGIARDVTARKKAAEELFYLAYHDSLTGLRNREAFYENLEKELAYAGRYEQQRSLLFIDLDKFKHVNDRFGHETGDLFLQDFADRIGRNLRTADNFYRLGGDEFVVLLSEPHDHSPETAARRIIEAMKEPFQVQSATIDFVTASIGIAIFPLHGADAESLLRSADRSMYRAKAKGNTYSIDESS